MQDNINKRNLNVIIPTRQRMIYQLSQQIKKYESQQIHLLKANYEDVMIKRNRTPLITYGMYRKEKQKKYQQDPFKVSNWTYDEQTDTYICPNNKCLSFQYHSTRKDSSGFVRQFKVYECENCTGCPLRQLCTKASEGVNRKLSVNLKWEQQKAYVQQKLSEPKTEAIYRQRKTDVEPVFGCLKANLGFTRFSVRGKSKVKNEIGLALMATNLRKYTQRGA